MKPHGAEFQLIAVACLGTAMIGALFARPYLPDQFVRDDGHIRLAIADPTTTDAESFRTIAHLYRLLGLEDNAPGAALLGVTVFVVAVFAAIGWQQLARLTWVGLILLTLMTGVAVVYLGQYSKELVTVVLATVVLLLPRTALGEIAVVAVCLLHAALLRPYWVLIAAAYVGWRILQRYRVRPLLMLVCLVAGYGVLSVVFAAVLGGGLESQREWMNAERAGTSVDTLIIGPFPGATGALSVASVLVVLAMLLVPLPLLATGSPTHMAAAVLLTAIWVLVLSQLLHRGARSGRAPFPPAAPRAAALLLAVVTVQALFEPDYGSYLKHLSGLLPLACALLPLRPSPAATNTPAVDSLPPMSLHHLEVRS